MKRPATSLLRVLLVEDSENDALLLLRELRRGGYEPVCERVSTPEEMERALEGASEKKRPWQIVISDYYMPRFRAPDALALLRKLGYDTPFVVVSGKIGEDATVAMMRAGAQDYVTKENMVRLCPVIERALREAEGRRERERAEKALRESEERYRVAAETASDAIVVIDQDSRILFINSAAEKIFGYARAEMIGQRLNMLMPERLRKVHEVSLARYLKTGRRRLDWRSIQLPGLQESGKEIPLEISFGEFVRDGERFFTGFVRDIIERKEAEEALREAREVERNRIARDLHDDIFQDIVYALQEIQIVQVISEDGGATGLEEAAEALRRSVEGLRGAVFELRLRETLGRSFVSSLEGLLDLNRRMARRSYELELIVEDGFPRALSERAGRELVRIVQEALANVRRHAEARHARVRLWHEGDLARVEVADDGRGFDAESPGVGVGPQSMRYRALELGVEGQPGRGTRVRFEAPVSRLVEG
jgi:two-component system, NarL family, sensor histidine kinase UhpB